MTEQEKLDVYIDQTLQIDRSDAANAMRIHDITGAWMMCANEPPDLSLAGWHTAMQQVMSRLQIEPTSDPSTATTHVFAAMDTLRAAIDQATANMQGLAYRDEVIRNQTNILDAFAMLLKLESGKFYMDMVPLLQALVEPPPDATVQ